MAESAERSGRRRLAALCVVLVAATTLVGTAGRADAAPLSVGLGTVSGYAVLSGSAVTNTGASVIDGDLGVSPGTAISGFPPGLVNGTTHSADAHALQAQSDLTAAYEDAAGRLPATSVAAELGGTTLLPGTYVGDTLELTGVVTLDARDDPDAVFVLKSADTLITASNSSVSLIGGADPCNVYWQVSSSITLGTGTHFVGTAMAMHAITATTGATVEGRLLARTAAVTLDTNLITLPTCNQVPATTTAVPTTEATTTTTGVTTTGVTTTEATTTTTGVTTTEATTTTGVGTTLPSSTSTSGSTPTPIPSTPVPSSAAGFGPDTPGLALATTTAPTTTETPGTTTDITEQSLARTGSDLGRLALMGIVAIGLGFILISASRQRVRAAR